MIGKWKKIKESPYITEYRKMSKVTFKLPNGAVRNFDILAARHIACVFALKKDNKVIITKQYRPGPDKIMFEIPAGVIEKNEKIAKAAQRELLEETGHKGQLKFIGTHYASAYAKTKIYTFIAKNCVKVSDLKLDETEFIELEFISLKKFRQLLRKGELTDTTSAYKALDYLKLL